MAISECKRGHALTPDNITNLTTRKEKRCKTCDRDRHNARYELIRNPDAPRRRRKGDTECINGHNLAENLSANGHCRGCRAETERRRRAKAKAEGVQLARGQVATAVSRFHALVNVVGECWEWQGTIDSDGYGKFGYGDVTVGAHRVSYILFVGEIPAGLEVDHLCFNRRCVNPQHLEAVTHAENVRRSRDRRWGAA